ncbi:hypothetical protein [Hyalangium versicolor]|uniref:hypothetical protein n=1 Tax=Hyalangium versicolor TaxID=2861190 RepID=UPI001CCDFD99|nr:hypothetical protein [Hyalangium versicolor]
MPSPPENDAIRIGNALSTLGHLAASHPLEEIRRSSGDAKLREIIQEAAVLLLDMVVHEEMHNPKVVPLAVEAKAALSQVRDLVQSVDWDDVERVQRLKAYACQALEALGFGVSE